MLRLRLLRVGSFRRCSPLPVLPFSDSFAASSRSVTSRSSEWLAAGVRQRAQRSGSFLSTRAASTNVNKDGRPFEERTKEETKERDANKIDMKPGKDNVQFTWGSAIFTCLVCGGCVAYYEYCRHKKETENRAITRSERIGVPKLGGPFELVDRKGVVKTDADFKGQYLLIYFGFSFCPDICPVEMEKQTRAIEILDADPAIGAIATPVFISVDPKRDTPAVVDEYCKEFHPRIAGLTGTPEQIKAVSRAYRVYFHANTTDDKEYLIDHSIIHYFMGKNGKFIDFFGKNMTAQEMADKMKHAILEKQVDEQERKARFGKGVKDMDEED